ncbi:hypothetical protein RF11_06621 [Thelohanellus kitauei]|uniref:CCHC-type domain-containing protein n=1 Tax=Thelohanellus kitauei TaxID=669202 RepID=A0A0C2ME51_THEKT|nr:hypothetical protein RF11_06621 [Thelohanellus kitauei]
MERISSPKTNGREFFLLVKTTTAHFKEPMNVDQRNWNNIKSIMWTHFDSRKLVVRERHRLYAKLTTNRIKLSENYHQTGFICAVNSEAVLKAVFHKSSDDLTFAQVVEIAAEVENTSYASKKQISDHTEEVNKILRLARDVCEINSDASSPCISCGKEGHFSQRCKLRFMYEETKVGNVVSSINDKIEIDLILNGHKFNLKVDAGSFESFISNVCWESLEKPILKHITITYRSENGSEIPLLGYFFQWVKYFMENGQKLCAVSKMSSGYLIRARFQTDFYQPRSIDLFLKEEVDKALDEGVKNGVWISCQFNEHESPFVPIRKCGTGTRRICGHYFALVNIYLDDHRYQTLSGDELLRQLNGYHYFTKVDLANAYNQIRLSLDSQKRQAISTHRGSEMVYLGHTISAQGISKGPRPNAILEMSRPNDRHSLRSFLGSTQFYHKFIKNLSMITAPLYDLTTYKLEWMWTLKHEEDSKILTKSQNNYPQIRNDGLSEVFGIDISHHFLYGRKFVIVTDRKPLISFYKRQPDPFIASI